MRDLVLLVAVLAVAGCLGGGQDGTLPSTTIQAAAPSTTAEAAQPQTTTTIAQPHASEAGNCSEKEGVSLCVSELSARTVRIAVNVSRTINVSGYSECDDPFTIERPDGTGGWRQVHVYAVFGKGCSAYISGPRPSAEDIAGYCWADWCPTETNLTPQEFTFNWTGKEYLAERPNLRENPHEISSDGGLYRVNFHGFTREFILGGCADGTGSCEGQDAGGVPICKGIGETSEGWYDSVTGELIKADPDCANCIAQFSDGGIYVRDGPYIPGQNKWMVAGPPGECKSNASEISDTQIRAVSCATERTSGEDCCPGLTKISVPVDGPPYTCEGCLNQTICSQCGNGHCESWENSRTCEKDCK